VDERGAVGLEGVGAGGLVGRLEVEVGAVELDDDGLGGAGGEERGLDGERRNDLFFFRRGPEDEALVAREGGAGVFGCRRLAVVVALGGDVGVRLRCPMP